MAKKKTDHSTEIDRRRSAAVVDMKQRFNALTGIRAFAAIAVVFQHYQHRPFYLPPEYHIKYGYLGVDMFFILSGFVLAHVHCDDFLRLSWRRCLNFYGLRLARIYPMHIVTLFYLLGTSLLALAAGRYTWEKLQARQPSFVVNLALLQSWWNQPESWNYPAWSISCEWFAYLLFPLLALLLIRLCSVRAIVVMLAFNIVLFGFAYARWMDHTVDWSSGLALLRIGFEFVLGALLWRAVTAIDMRKLPWTGLVAAAVLLCVPAYLMNSRYFEFFCVMAMAVVILAGAHGSARISRLLALPLFVYLGEISYSIYMVHAPLEMTMAFALHNKIEALPLAARVGVGLAFIMAVVGVAALSHRYIETPVRNWYRSITATRRVVASPQVA